MVGVEDVEAMIAELPKVTEGVSYGNRCWFVGKQHFAWIRPFSKADIKRFGDETPPAGPILAVRVDDLGEKEAVLAAGKRAVREAIVDGWLTVAPTKMAEAYLAR